MILSEGRKAVLYVMIFLKLKLLYFYDAKKDLKGTKLLPVRKHNG